MDETKKEGVIQFPCGQAQSGGEKFFPASSYGGKNLSRRGRGENNMKIPTEEGGNFTEMKERKKRKAF